MQAMPDNEFWKNIDSSVKGLNTVSQKIKKLEQALQKLAPASVLAFEIRFDLEHRRARSSLVWCAAKRYV